jgi:hypothetical protein
MPCPRHPPLAGALLAALAMAAALPAPAAAQIRRCTTPDGVAVYTDRSCESLGAVETRPATGLPGAAGLSRYRGGCARSVHDLVFEVSAAIDARDTNRLARSYHWVGMSARSGHAVIDRLDAIAQRPLLDIAGLRPAQPVVAPTQPMPLAGADGAAALPATPPTPRHPVALRIDQVLADGVTPSSTTFGLRRHMDCWWITF